MPHTEVAASNVLAVTPISVNGDNTTGGKLHHCTLVAEKPHKNPKENQRMKFSALKSSTLHLAQKGKVYG